MKGVVVPLRATTKHWYLIDRMIRVAASLELALVASSNLDGLQSSSEWEGKEKKFEFNLKKRLSKK